MVGDATTHHMWSDYGVSGSYGKLLAGAPLLHVPIVSNRTPLCREHSRKRALSVVEIKIQEEGNCKLRRRSETWKTSL